MSYYASGKLVWFHLILFRIVAGIPSPWLVHLETGLDSNLFADLTLDSNLFVDLTLDSSFSFRFHILDPREIFV